MKPIAPPRPRVDTHRPLKTLARSLVRAGLLTESQASALCDESARTQLPLVQVVAASSTLPPLDLAHFISRQFGYPLIDIRALIRDSLPLTALPKTWMALHLVVPIAQRGHTVTVAMADPTDIQTLDTLRSQLDAHIDALVAPQDTLKQFIASL